MAETIRTCRREDVRAVAGMFARVFQGRKRLRGNGLASYFEEVIFGRAAAGSDPRSRVFLDAKGDVRGFIGIWPRRLLMQGRTIEAAIAGSLMVDRPEEHPTAGARLLRAFLAGPQELSFSETANDISQRMWEKAGGERLAASSLDWLRVLRPAGFAIAAAGKVFRPASLLRPAASGFDHLIEARGRNPMAAPVETTGFRDAEATSAELAEIIPALSGSYVLHPDWQSPDLSFLLAHAETKERYGELHRRVVYARGRGPVGCYLYYARRGEVARVLQVLALPEAVGVTLDNLFRHAASLGCVGVRGRADAALLDALIARRCVLFHGAAMVMHARDKALLNEVRGSRALLTGLAGESWTRLIGGEFA
ncbi:MAG: hypothetical protein K8F92_15865 [Hyphomicrobium sp.]|uniref:hypothetical protein n=1 Tax=Hyphomicrobium sp. TaxID=82 RepID=UPI001329F182|nr:hypothetical protein [Hyphomicrobium sp.]KAB2940292.1 MAG: hypothetical protein F9K20_13665 [Hyphomicrobium sp.]MBZ0211108.1 hypothetical protein [Hyphomicrobium sp.]